MWGVCLYIHRIQWQPRPQGDIPTFWVFRPTQNEGIRPWGRGWFCGESSLVFTHFSETLYSSTLICVSCMAIVLVRSAPQPRSQPGPHPSFGDDLGQSWPRSRNMLPATQAPLVCTNDFRRKKCCAAKLLLPRFAPRVYQFETREQKSGAKIRSKRFAPQHFFS